MAYILMLIGALLHVTHKGDIEPVAVNDSAAMP